MRYRSAFALLLFLWCAAAGAAPQTQPAATRPAEADTPRAALKLLNLALRDGDAGAVKGLFQTTEPDGAKLVGAMADYAAALAALHREAVKTFGKKGADEITGDMEAESAEGLDEIEHAQVSIQGDTATVKYRGADESPVKLTRVGGKWTLPLSQLVGEADSEAQHHRAEELAGQVKLAQLTTSEVTSGKFKTPDEAAQAWRARVMQAVLAGATQKKGE